MTTKRPDLDARWHPVNKASPLDEDLMEGGMVQSYMQFNVSQELHRQFVAAGEKHGISPKQLLTKIYYEACRELGIDTTLFEDDLGKYGNRWRKAKSVRKLHLSTVIMDECDLPGVVESQDISEIDPYYSSFVVTELAPERQSIHLYRLETEVKKAAKAIERLTSLKAYTSVFAEGRISKEEAKRELREILDLMPTEIGDTLWGWCSVNDAINLIRRWKGQVLKQIQLQLEIEQLRCESQARVAFEAKVDADIQRSKARILQTYRTQQKLRPKHGANWPTWAGEMESYLDHASSPEMYDTSANWYRVVATDHYLHNGIPNQVQTECTVDISKGLTDEEPN